MHEAAIAQSILDIAGSKFIQTVDAVAIKYIKVQLGEFRNVDIDSLRFAFDSLKVSVNGLHKSELVAEISKAIAVCNVCQQSYHPGVNLAFRCDKCGGGIDKLISGEELNIIGITIEIESAEKN